MPGVLLYSPQAAASTALAIEREKAQLEGTIGQYEAAIGTARQRLAEAELRMTEFEAARAHARQRGLHRLA